MGEIYKATNVSPFARNVNMANVLHLRCVDATLDLEVLLVISVS